MEGSCKPGGDRIHRVWLIPCLMVGQEKTLAPWSWLGWCKLNGQMKILGSECSSLPLYEHVLCYLLLLVSLLV